MEFSLFAGKPGIFVFYLQEGAEDGVATRQKLRGGVLVVETSVEVVGTTIATGTTIVGWEEMDTFSEVLVKKGAS